MRFSIIMPSFLGSYRNSASNLESKIERAINSVLAQSFEDWELVVIADGCEKTEIIVKPYVYEYLPKVRLLQIPKQKTWSGAVRNAGIFNAKGEIIIYLDVDDYWGTDHLKIVNDNFKKNDWVIFNDWIYNKKADTWKERPVRISMGQCGTSNVAHRRSLDVYWTNDSYLHDYVLLKALTGVSNHFIQIPTAQYYVCHIPNAYDV